MKISDMLRQVAHNPKALLETCEGIEMGESWDPQMTEEEKAEVRAAKMRAESALARKK